MGMGSPRGLGRRRRGAGQRTVATRAIDGGMFAVSLVAAACGGAASGKEVRHAPVTAGQVGIAATELRACEAPGIGGSAGAAASAAASPHVRAAAQRGLAFLGDDTIAWQGQNNCYGCHVQAVALEAFVVGRRNQYAISQTHFDAVLTGMLDLPGGARGPNGFSVGGNATHLIETSQAFGGAGLAQYDQHIATDLQTELLRTAENLLEYQEADGSVRATDQREPVGAGPMQSTTQAAQTWRQAHARTADERWLPPIARAEGYLRSRAEGLTAANNPKIQDIDYAILGLLEAGASPSEGEVRLLEERLRGQQGADGGWGYQLGGSSNAFATGQAVYVLKRLGADDADEVVRRGMGWLVEMQRSDGSWSDGGERRGEAMWAVLGLVTVDLLSLEVAGLIDGSHVNGSFEIQAGAEDNQGGTVRQVELHLDDVPIARSCGSRIRERVAIANLPAGMHQLDVIAENASGQQSRRRIEFFTGDHYLVRVGTQFADGTTQISLRNVAPAGTAGRVRLRVRRADGAGRAGDQVFTTEQPATPGPMHFAWQGEAGTVGSRYVAEVTYLGEGNREVQTVSAPFVHDTAEAQQQRFGEVAGRLNFDGDDVANAEVELVDGDGNVVQRVQSTRSGQYRFRNVDGGNYRVRVQRRGFRAAEAAVQAAPASAADADLDLVLH